MHPMHCNVIGKSQYRRSLIDWLIDWLSHWFLINWITPYTYKGWRHVERIGRRVDKTLRGAFIPDYPVIETVIERQDIAADVRRVVQCVEVR